MSFRFLPIAIGKATRLLQYLPEGKAYRAIIRFGVQTTTDDLEGEVVYYNEKGQVVKVEVYDDGVLKETRQGAK